MEGALGSEQKCEWLGFVRALGAEGSWKMAGPAHGLAVRGCGDVLRVSTGK